MRIITHSPPLTPSKPLFKELNILTVFQIYEFQLSCLIFRHINNLLPSPISCLFEFNYNIHDHFTRHRQDLHISSHKYSFSISAQGQKNWNSIPLLIPGNH
jgi:hypothetical protein